MARTEYKKGKRQGNSHDKKISVEIAEQRDRGKTYKELSVRRD